ncbi:MAG TPA: tRNA (adenosine(37)-N6)-threonylcarbamoyltransferase complex ATPase subunit type 1 TsaE [Actinomycetota bacterium]|jgi:tRNA threonylcarbamoyladenosine biosynthesis protein TsaE|nr:tRNA (adenosine(37)-N6)-threonylcarbamoyltransferase complex ATPase subunit type 1 TsaE [Actinomycetota bacterium]
MRIELTSFTPEDTRTIGGALGQVLGPGDAVALTGELGAGKTTLVQGVAAAVGFTGPVVSPTFTLVREYQGRPLRIFHVDVYRLERVQDVLDLGLDEMADQGGVLLVEWGDAVEGLLPGDHLLVELWVPGPDEQRRISLAPTGASWQARWASLEAALGGWIAG